MVRPIRSGGPTRFSASMSTWIQAHSTLVALLAAAAVLIAAALAPRHHLRPRDGGRHGDTGETEADCCGCESRAAR
ncbi:hypothetical protein [Streptomyces sp. Ag109_O5-1]|uniref:hypothetical protein n=1 Tax=Streptomyces sp. Ag109_O5-1 TaxID=1938851 RepID=UPI00162A8AAF|nr:hypothetical protein [Streptomyces sp. Ag109_O5-1]